jgi:sugar phosphate isomerase/epimerase
MRLNERNQNRRSFLKATSALALGSGAFFKSALSAANQLPIGVQLYCVRKELAEDFDKTMAAVAGIGFDGVEFADYFGRSAKELRKSLDDNGLKCCGTHIVLPDMLGDKLKETVEFNLTLGNPYLIVRWLDESFRTSPEVFDNTVGLFNEVADNLKPHGLRVGYHNHDYIFGKFDGKFLWDILGDGTSKDVILQLDTGNAMVQSGVDVVELLKRHPGRTGTIHIKPYSSKKPDAFLGDDELHWPAIIKLCQTSAGTEWYIVEYEVEGIPPLEALKDNYLRFKKMVA